MVEVSEDWLLVFSLVSADSYLVASKEQIKLYRLWPPPPLIPIKRRILNKHHPMKTGVSFEGSSINA